MVRRDWFGPTLVLGYVLAVVAGLLFVDVGRLERANEELRQQVAQAPQHVAESGQSRALARSSAPVLGVGGGAKQAARCGPGLLEVDFPFVCSFGEVVLVVAVRSKVDLDLFSADFPLLFGLAFIGSEPFQLPPSVGRFTDVTGVNIARSASGTIPSQLGLLTRLSYLYISANDLTSTIPSQLGCLTDLKLLVIKHDTLSSSSTIPVQFGQLRQVLTIFLERLDLGGTIPSQLGNFQNASAVDLSSNRLEETIPQQLLALPSLARLALFRNRLSGNLAVPSALAISDYDVGENQLEGTLPSQLATLSALTNLNCSSNLLSGLVPSQMGALTLLTALALDDNRITGTIPSHLGLLTALEVLHLANNQLTGSIPAELAALSHLASLNLSHNQFEGQLPPGVAELVTDCEASGLQDKECGYVAPHMLNGTFFVAFVALSLVLVVGMAALGRRVHLLRGTRPIRAANPRFLLTALSALSLASLSVPALGLSMLDTSLAARRAGCIAFPIMLSSAVVLLLVSIAARNFPIWRIFDNPNLDAIKFSRGQLRLGQAAGVVVNFVWAIPLALRASPQHGQYQCNFRAPVILTVGLGYVAVIMLYTATMCVLIRNAPSIYNDTRRITNATLFMCSFAVVVLVPFLTGSGPTTKFVSLALCVLVCCAVFVVLVLVPKIFRKEAVLPRTRPTPKSKAGVRV